MTEPLLTLDGVSAGYGDLTILRDISLSVAAGEVEQNLSLIEQVADRVIVIDHGEIVHQTRNGPDMRAEILEKLKV